MAKIENHQYTIEEAFSNCFYLVPDYQREYVWKEREVRQLLEDICDQSDAAGDRDYFIGTVIVAPTSEKNHLEVIDGQQRLTTFYLLLCALKVRFAGLPQEAMLQNLIRTSYTSTTGDVIEKLKLDPRYEHSGEVIRALVYANGDPNTVRGVVKAQSVPSFGSLENLLDAYEIIWEYLNENMDELHELRAFWGYLANHVVFIQISTDVSSALKIFETINERGVGLNPMDLLKNLLFTHVDPSQFTSLKSEWKKITGPLEKAKEKPLRFLRYFLMANYVIQNPEAKLEKERTEPVLREDQIYDWLTHPIHAKKCDYAADPFGFVRRIARGAELYVGFVSDRDNHGEHCWQMDNLRKLSGGAFTLHTIMLLAAAPLPQAMFRHFVAQLECFMFIHFFTQSPAKELERRFSHWADKLRTIAALPSVEQRAALNTFIDEHLRVEAEAKKHLLEDVLIRYNLNTLQKYRTRYFLAKIAQQMDMAYQGTKETTYLTDLMKLEIEHILPNNPEADLLESFEAENPATSYESLKNRLGNLTLLEKPINIVLGNEFFERKKEEYPKSATYLTRSISQLAEVGMNTSISRINTRLKAFDSWGAGQIEERQAVLASFAEDVWRIRQME